MRECSQTGAGSHYCPPQGSKSARVRRKIRSQSMGASSMTAFIAVRFRVKPDREQEFLDAHRHVAADWPGVHRASIIRTGERSYCLIAEWPDMDSVAKARPQLIATLDTFRDTLEDLGS